MRIGENGSNDPIYLIERSGGIETNILTSTPAIVATSFEINVKVIYRSNGDWELYTDLAGGTAFQLDATANHTATVLGQHLGVWLKYTTSNVTKFTYDDIYAGSIQGGSTAPTITSVTAISDTELEVEFDKAIDPVTGEEISNYIVDKGIGNPTSILQNGTNPALFTLTFGPSFIDGDTYTLTISDVEYLDNNVMATQNETFVYTAPDLTPPTIIDVTAISSTEVNVEFDEAIDVVTGEIVSNYTVDKGIGNPTSVIQDGTNPALFTLTFANSFVDGDTYNLTASGVQDEAGNTLTSQTEAFLYEDIDLIPPTLFSVTAISETELEVVFDEVIDIVTGETVLNYTVDNGIGNPTSVVQDGTNLALFTLTFTNLFVDGDTYSLEVSNVQDEAGNVIITESKNFVYIAPDITPPSIIDVTATSLTELLIEFDEAIDQATGETVMNYTVDKGLGNPIMVQQNATNLALFTLTFGTSFVIGETYTVEATHVEDFAGNAMTIQNETFVYIEPQMPDYGDIVINEFIARTSPTVGMPNVQFVELYNRSNKYFHLNGWKLSDNNSSGTIQDVWLNPGEYLILVPTSGLTDYPQATNVTSWANLNLTGDEIKLSTDNGTVVDFLSYTDGWYIDATKKGGGWSLERINPDLVCSSSDNWRASVDPSGGTPGVQNSVFDNTPDLDEPTVIGFETELPSRLVIRFSERMDSLSLENATFTSTPALTIASRNLVAKYPTELILAFNETLNVGELYSFTLSDFSDCSGNTNDYTGTFVLPQTPVVGDIVINEFIPRVSPAVGLPEVQFVEVYNRSNKYFHLDGWKLSDNNSSGTIQGGWLYPGEYLLLVPTSGAADYPGATTVTGWASLNLTGDDVRISTDAGVVIDELTYTDAWYKDDLKKGEGWSIERINPELLCSSSDNWRASVDPSGGTPGIQNSIYNNTPDTDGPTVIGFETELPNRLVIRFSEPMDSLSLENTAFTSAPVLTVSSRELVGRYPTKLILEFNESFDIGELYSFNLNDFADCSGNTNDYSGTFVLPQTPDVGDIVINEFIPRVSPAVGMPEVQYVELYNRSNKYLYLENWKLSNNSTSGTIQGGWIYPGEYLLLVPTSGAVDYPSASIVSSWSSLKVTGDDVRLTAEDGTVVDFLTYTDAWYKDDLKKGEGWSIERINPELLCSSSDNWRASVDPSGGTPGIQNSIYNNTPDTDGPTVIGFETELPNRLVIRFSEPMDSLSLENTAFTSTPALTVSSRELVGRYPTKLTLEFNESFIAGETYTFSLSNFSDCSGNTNNYDGTFIIPQASTKGDLIINEILFNPLTGGSDFIELYNNSDKYIDMKDWVLANYKNDTISNQKKVIQSYVLAPHDYVVLTVDSNFQLMNYPVATPGKFIQMSSLPSYTNDSSTVYLIFNDEVMDKVSYSEKWHFSLLQSKKGLSLERFSADEPSNSASNWHSASETIGFATPGRINSQDMKPGEEGGTLTLSSNSFSPDGDGFEDALILTYEVSSPDLLGDLIIYDDKGRLIKVLFQKELLGGKGSVKWEGTKGDGTKAAIGPYIIMFDMFDLNSSKVKTVRKVVTLAGRL